MKKLIIAVIIVIMISLITAYAGISFTDVKPDKWYYNDVVNAVGLGLINGKGDNKYCPDDNLTYAEAFKLAACMHQLNAEGKVTLENGDPWYAEYVEYCFINGIYGKDMILVDDVDMNAKITRSGYMGIFANALPYDMLSVINYVPDGAIPDVQSSEIYAEGVYKLYRAGIVAGSDAAHNCKPSDNIKRSEVAAILTRMMDSSKRVKFDMGTPEKTDPFVITEPLKAESINAGSAYMFSLKVEGGKEPYKYVWSLFSEGMWLDADFMVAMEPQIAEMFHGLDTSTLIFSGFAGVDEAIKFRCKIVDSLGNTQMTEELILEIKNEESKEETESTEKPDDTEKSDETEKSAESDLKVTVEKTEYELSKAQSIKVPPIVSGGAGGYKYRWYKLVDGEWKNWQSGTYNERTEPKYDPSLHYYAENPGDVVKTKCVVTDADGNVAESEVITITVMDYKFVVDIPKEMKLSVGEYYTLHVEVKGGKEPYTYNWYYFSATGSTATGTPFRNNEICQGADTNTLSFMALREHVDLSGLMAIYINCHVKDADGNTIQSENAIVKNVTPLNTPLKILYAPKEFKLLKTDSIGGDQVMARVIAYKPGQMLHYQWYYESRSGRHVELVEVPAKSGISGQNSDHLNIRTETAAELLGMRFVCKVTDDDGEVVQTDYITVPQSLMFMLVEPEASTASDTSLLLVGTVKAGTLKPGDRVFFSCLKDSVYRCGLATVDKVEMFGKSLDEICAYDRAGVYLKDVTLVKADSVSDVSRKYSRLTGIGINHTNVLIKLPEDYDERLEQWNAEHPNQARLENSTPTRS